jgi:Family of unknown function (DUF6194)
VTEDEIIQTVSALPGVATVTASEANGAPEVAWGDSFFFYDPDGVPANRRLPFATIVTKDYDGFDTSSDLNRPGVFRLNLAVGRTRFEQLFGFPPAEFPHHEADFDPAALDQVIPNPAYATQGWASVLVPGPGSDDMVRELITYTYERAKDRYERRQAL